MIIVIILFVLVFVTLASNSQIQSEKNVPHDVPVNNEIDAPVKKAGSEQERR